MSDFLPPELATDGPPLSDADLQALYDEWAELESEAGIDPAPALGLLQETWADRSTEVFPGSGTEGPAATAARWRVEDDMTAEWAGRKLAIANENLAHLTMLRDEWMQRISDWYTSEGAADRRTALFMEDRLADYAMRRREAGGAATLTLPSVVIKTTDRKPAAAVEDDNVAGDYIEQRCLGPAAVAEPWIKALLTAGHDVDDVVKLNRKVYLGPLRDLVRIEARTDGYEVHLHLACGHDAFYAIPTMEQQQWAIGEMVACASCYEASPNAVAAQPVEWIAVRPNEVPVVVGPDGEPVPGATVKPGGITTTVKARQ